MGLTSKKKKAIEFMESLVYGRYTMAQLNEMVSNHFGETIKIEEIESEGTDGNLLFASRSDDTYGYFDIYFLPMLKEGFGGTNMFVTEIAWEFE